MMVFTSIYGAVDGFLSNFEGKTHFAAVTFTFPLLMMLGATGFMLGAGGSALVEMLAVVVGVLCLIAKRKNIKTYNTFLTSFIYLL